MWVQTTLRDNVFLGRQEAQGYRAAHNEAGYAVSIAIRRMLFAHLSGDTVCDTLVSGFSMFAV